MALLSALILWKLKGPTNYTYGGIAFSLHTRQQKILGYAPPAPHSREPQLTLARRIAGAECEPAVTLEKL